MKSNIQQVADWLGVSRTTLYRRLKSGRLSCPESDRIVGMASVLEAAARLFDDDREEAIRWMRTPLRGLGNKSPVQNLQTNVERDAVIELIYRLERGVFS
jgi:putative toxin-antitoxin system antitoxin component (TIGR02293 family)